MYFTGTMVFRAVITIDNGFHDPVADQPAIETELVYPVSCRTGAV
jgi:hypothetical protein